jgi:MFS family permease
MATAGVGNFVQLALARVGAGIGEAGCLPPTYSLLGDYYPKPEERTRAMSIYWLAGPIASLVAFAGGGWLNQLWGWRLTFFLAGIPGLIMALCVRLTVHEPRNVRASATPVVSSVSVLRTLWGQRSLRHLCVGILLLFSLALGLAPWYASFLIRCHGLGTAELGVWLGLICGVGGAIGMLLGGYSAGRPWARTDAAQMRLTALTLLVLTPCFGLFLLLPSTLGSLLAFIPLQIAFNFFFGPTFALLQRLVDERVRATSLALVMLLSNLLGMGLGPELVGVLSDHWRPALGADSLRWAMLAWSAAAPCAAYHFWRVSRTVSYDLEKVLDQSGLGPLSSSVSA